MVKLHNHKKSITVSIAEGKERFSRIINDAAEEKKEIVVTKRGKPVAVIIPYKEYKQSKRVEGYRKIITARNLFANKGISAENIFKESRKQLEKKS